MTTAKRHGRDAFFSLLCLAWAAVILAPPIVMALEPASAGASRAPRTFEAADADGDGFVTLREARAVRGLAAQLIEADANRDGRLDKVEYARALSRTEPSR